MTYRTLWIIPTLLSAVIVGGCATKEAPQSTRIWGGVGFVYEADKISGEKRSGGSVATTHVGFEKRIGTGLDLGAEFSGYTR